MRVDMFRIGTLAVVLTAALSAGCAGTLATPRPFPLPGGTTPPASRPRPPDAGSPVGTTGTAPDMYTLVGTALALRGTPYRSGGTGPDGFDCSGFVSYVFGRHGVFVPRTVVEQFEWGRAIGADAIAPGDLVFFDTSGGPSHVGLDIGGDAFVHAPNSRGEVRVERMSSSYWSSRFIGARRVQ
jgi:cell wall-associated NlpC family hydrolase